MFPRFHLVIIILVLAGRGIVGQDVINRAKKYLAGTPDIGAYSDSQVRSS